MTQQSHSWPYIQKTLIQKDTWTPKVHRSTVYDSQDNEATQMSINRWTDKEDMVLKYNGILRDCKKEWNNAVFSNIDEPKDYHTKYSKSEKYK